jgi:hypothetical protein
MMRFGATSYQLPATSYQLQATSYKLQAVFQGFSCTSVGKGAGLAHRKLSHCMEQLFGRVMGLGEQIQTIFLIGDETWRILHSWKNKL